MIRHRYRTRTNKLSSVVIPFSPTDISGLRLWLKADDAATITQTGGAVSLGPALWKYVPKIFSGVN